jgi:hypothetical protein
MMTLSMQIRPLFLLSLLFALTLPARATLVAGSEKGVTAPVPDVAAFDQSLARIASDGDGFLAVWVDRTLAGIGDVHGARLSPEGKRLGDDVLPIAVTAGEEAPAAVAFGGGRYFVVWSTVTAVRGRFVGRDGTMSEAFDIAVDQYMSGAPLQIAFNGSRFLVTWLAPELFRGALVDVNGTVLKTFDIASRQQTSFEAAPVAANGTFHFVSAITDFSRLPNNNGYPLNIGVTPIDADGNVGTRVVVVPPDTPVFDLRVAASGDDYVIAWSTAIGIAGGTVRAMRVSPTGLGTIETIPTEGMYLHDLAADSGGFFVIYGADTTKYLRRLGTANSTVIATPPTENAVLDIASNGALSVAVVRGNSRYVVGWHPSGADLYLVRLNTNDLGPLAIAPRHQQLPDIAAAGDLRLAVWCEYIGSDRRLGIVGTRLSATGDPLDTSILDLQVRSNHPIGARVASNGTDWLVTWIYDAKLYASRVARDGSLIDTTPRLIASDTYVGSDVAVSWDGTQYVVIFLRGDFFRGLHTTTCVARIPAQGPVTAPELTLSEVAPIDVVSVGSGPEGSLLVWRNFSSLRGALLSPGGTLTPVAFPSALSLTPRPSVAWNNGTFLMAAVFRLPSGLHQVQWLRVSATGVVTMPSTTFFDVDIDPPDGYSVVETEAYGDGFLVYWKGAAEEKVYVARVDREGLLADGPQVIGTSIGGGARPHIGATGNMVVYARRIGHTTREIARVFARTVQTVTGKPRRRAVR